MSLPLSNNLHKLFRLQVIAFVKVVFGVRSRKAAGERA
ncbi:MAG: hypothetical protein ACI8UZ_003393 [Akkermansiaceae bacterium]